MADDLLVVQVRSGIGTKPKHRGTLRALGLRGIGSSNVLPDRPEIRGMIARVPHLVRVEVAPDGRPAAPVAVSRSGGSSPAEPEDSGSAQPGEAGSAQPGEAPAAEPARADEPPSTAVDTEAPTEES